jgi:hypothetical protein
MDRVRETTARAQKTEPTIPTVIITPGETVPPPEATTSAPSDGGPPPPPPPPPKATTPVPSGMPCS